MRWELKNDPPNPAHKHTWLTMLKEWAEVPTGHSQRLVARTPHYPNWVDICASYQIRKIAGCSCAGNVGNVFPGIDFKGNRYSATPTCIPARAWRTCRGACLYRKLAVAGKSFLANPGACANRNFTYLVKGPLNKPRVKQYTEWTACEESTWSVSIRNGTSIWMPGLELISPKWQILWKSSHTYSPNITFWKRVHEVVYEKIMVSLCRLQVSWKLYMILYEIS